MVRFGAFSRSLVSSIQCKNRDIHVSFLHAGKTADDTSASGTITIPEAAHDTEEDEYVVRDPAIKPSLLEKQMWLTCP